MTKTKELFTKWMQNLFYVQCAALAFTLIAKLPFIGSWFSWVIRLATIATIFVLYKLSPLNTRYLKAAIFMGVTVLATLLSSGLGLLVIVGMVCSIIATYQELIGHSELMAGIDAKLSKNWHSLFYWELLGGFLIGVILGVVSVAISLAGNVELGVEISEIFADGFDIILNIVYLYLMKRMLRAYASYEPQEEVIHEEV